MKVYDHEKRIKRMIKLIEALDACRAGKTTEFIKFEKTLKSLRLTGIPVKIKVLKRSIEDIIKIPLKHPKYSRIKKLNKISSIISYVGMGIASLGMLIVLIFKSYGFLYYVSLVSLLIAIYVIYTIRWYIDELTIDIYNDKIDELIKKGEPLRKFNEYLIKEIIREVKRGKLNREKYKFSLYFVDYEGIEVIKRPSKFRSKYLVKIKF